MAYSHCFSSGFDMFNDRGGIFPSISSCMRELEGYGDAIRKHMPDVDFARVLFVRSRRMVLLSVALMEQHIEQYGPWVRFLDSFVQIFALYHAVVLLPRFWMNTLYVFNHLGDKAAVEMQARLWEMAYDFGWLMTSVLSFFVLVGPLAPCALFLAVATPTYHLLMYITRLAIAYSEGKSLERDYAELMPLMVKIGVSVCVVSAAVVILLCCTNPVLAFAAAAVAVLATVAGRYLPDYLAKSEEVKQAPATPLSENSMFSKTQGDNVHLTEKSQDLSC
ncbi:MAG: hypothetical protein P1U39_02950 [Legionellaceae bacterium]|jgi:hypothetical protein|nr:hypothetical protein [Legionellaceae bacterium]